MPGVGVLFWTCLIFLVFFFVLKKWAFPVINGMLKKREEKISSALQQAEETRKTLSRLKDEHEQLLDSARQERERILAEAGQLKRQIEESGRQKAEEEYKRIVSAARADIEREKQEALEEIRVQVADISIDMAEKILESELEDRDRQRSLVEKGLKNIKM